MTALSRLDPPAERPERAIAFAREATAGATALAPRLWRPKRVVITRDAREWEHGRAIAKRCAALGAEVEELPGNRLTGLRGEDERDTYRRAKGTLAITVAPPSVRRPRPIPPSADWQFHLAHGCPAHCQYCYLAGSLPGPPVTRAYANLTEILDALEPYEGSFEASCYADPLGLEHLTGSLAAAARHFAQRSAARLRFTTKYDGVEPLLGLDHRRRTRPRVSLNAAWVTRRLEGGTAPLERRIGALRRLAAEGGYPVGIVLAPLMPFPGWRESYAALLDDISAAMEDVPDPDLTVECITHRFSETSKEVLRGWYPASALEMDESRRAVKRTRFGARKYVYRREDMRELRGWFEEALASRLPAARVQYWT